MRSESDPTLTLHPPADELLRPSPGASGRYRVHHASATHTFAHPPEVVFNAFARFARYEAWAPALQGPAHWLAVRAGGVGSQFVLYDKPGPRHLAHFGVVTACERGRHFAWQAPFSDWPRMDVGTFVELTPSADGGTRLRETLFFEAREDHLPILSGFLATPGYDAETFVRFLRTRLAGLDRLLQRGALSEEEVAYPFAESRLVAADWAGRIAEGEWVRVLYADGELDFDGPVDAVFNAFTRFARYRDWTRMIHVGCEWLDVRAGGVGSRFLLWEKPGGRQVMHQAVVTELERNERFTWRAPFAEWGKVFIGTSMRILPTPGGRTRAHHVLFADLPAEYLPVFGGFGALHGFDLTFETFHIHEEARGFNGLLQADAFTGDDTAYLFDADAEPAVDWPLQEGRRWPQETLTLQPDRVITYEELVVELAGILGDLVPSPAFMRTYRDLQRIRRFSPTGGSHAHT